jgi:hypothetical protein
MGGTGGYISFVLSRYCDEHGIDRHNYMLPHEAAAKWNCSEETARRQGKSLADHHKVGRYLLIPRLAMPRIHRECSPQTSRTVW